MVGDDILNNSDQPQIIEEFQLCGEKGKRRKTDLLPVETYLVLSLDNPGGSLHMNHPSLSSSAAVNQSPTQHHSHCEPDTAVASASHRSSVDSDCIPLEYQQVNESSSVAKSNDRASANPEEETDCQIMDGKDSQVNEQPAKKRQEPIVIQAEAATPAESKTRRITLKMPPMNGQKEPNNLILKIDNGNQAIAERPISSSSSFASPKKGTTKPIIQTFTPPKLIIKPLRPPPDQAPAASLSTVSASHPVASTSASKTNDSPPEKVKRECVREGCTKPAVKDPQWDGEFCSADCLFTHCKTCFENWVASRRAESN